MRKLLVVACLAAAGIGACAERTAPRTHPPDVVVEASGSVVRGHRVGAAARVYVRGNRDVGPIVIRISFVDRSGREIARANDGLPYCGRGGHCWWAASFPVEQFTADTKAIAGARVTVKSSSPYDGPTRVTSFAVARSRDGLRGAAPDGSGTAYVVGLDGDRPRWGISVNVSAVSSRDVFVPKDLLPPLGPSERFRAYFYPGTAPAGD